MYFFSQAISLDSPIPPFELASSTLICNVLMVSCHKIKNAGPCDTSQFHPNFFPVKTVSSRKGLGRLLTWLLPPFYSFHLGSMDRNATLQKEREKQKNQTLYRRKYKSVKRNGSEHTGFHLKNFSIFFTDTNYRKPHTVGEGEETTTTQFPCVSLRMLTHFPSIPEHFHVCSF